MVKNLPANARDVGSIPGPGRSPGGGSENVSPVACSWAGLHLSYLRASHLGLTPDLRMPPALTACCLEVCLLSQNHGLEVRWPGFQSQLLRFLCDFRPSRFIVMATLRDEQVSIREVFRTLGG